MPRSRAIFTPWHFLMFAFLAGTVLGTVMANTLAESGGAEQGSARIFMEMLEGRAELPAGTDGTALVVLRRLLETGFLWALGLTGFSIPGFAAVSLYLGLSSSMILSVITMEKGGWGILVYAATLFPQIFIYLLVFLLLAFWGISREKKLHRPAFFLLLIASALGALMEAGINPWILGRIL